MTIGGTVNGDGSSNAGDGVNRDDSGKERLWLVLGVEFERKGIDN
jgi:hypothetical protein